LRLRRNTALGLAGKVFHRLHELAVAVHAHEQDGDVDDLNHF
jgi:hypothetical protein